MNFEIKMYEDKPYPLLERKKNVNELKLKKKHTRKQAKHRLATSLHRKCQASELKVDLLLSL